MERTKVVTRPLRKLSLMSGSVTVSEDLAAARAHDHRRDSSMDLSICRKAEIPLRVPTGRLRTMNTMIRIAPVPYRPCRKPVREHAVGKAADVAHAQHRAGHGHGQHGLTNSIKPLEWNFFLTTR